jgi:hypothetical protein
MGSSYHPHMKYSMIEYIYPHEKEVQMLAVCGEGVADDILGCTGHS